jgi:hypothetical protein
MDVAAQQKVLHIAQAGSLSFGVGRVGADRHLESDDKQRYAAELADCTLPAPTETPLWADCMDERPTVRLHDGTNDFAVLAARWAFQLPGGTVLAATKAAVAADAAYLRAATTMQEAYEVTYRLLIQLGFADAGHAGCGASKLVRQSAANRLPDVMIIDTLAALGADAEQVRSQIERLDRNVQLRLQAGFYDGWSSEWHVGFLQSHDPQRFAYLQEADDAVRGHYASGLYIVPKGSVFAKDQFVRQSGRQAFALTFDFADQIANVLGGSDAEKALIALAFRDDALNVANQIVAVGLEVFAGAEG